MQDNSTFRNALLANVIGSKDRYTEIYRSCVANLNKNGEKLNKIAEAVEKSQSKKQVIRCVTKSASKVVKLIAPFIPS